MHIGIVTSGNENIRLYNILNKFEIKTTIWYDSIFWPYGDKPFEEVIKRIEEGIKFLKSKNVQKVIVSPTYELYLRKQNKHQQLILPIFNTYLQDYVFKYSPVGKLGIAGNHSDKELAQRLISNISKKYKPTETQKKISKKDFSFRFWCKETPMRDYFLNLNSPRQNMINKFIKLDCRYFKDAKIDTLIPMQYSYLMFEKLFSHTFFTKQIRFHGKKAFFDVFSDISKNESIKTLDKKNTKKITDNMEVQIHFTGSDHLLLVQKKRQRLICQGKSKSLRII